MGSARSASLRNHFFSSSVRFIEKKTPRPKMRSMAMPEPTIRRKDQNIGATPGIVSAAACLICSGVAAAMSFV